MHPAGEKRGGRPNDKYTAEALESIKQDLTRFEVQNNHRNNQVSSQSILLLLKNNKSAEFKKKLFDDSFTALKPWKI